MARLNYQKASWKRTHETNIRNMESLDFEIKAHKRAVKNAPLKLSPSSKPKKLIPKKRGQSQIKVLPIVIR